MRFRKWAPPAQVAVDSLVSRVRVNVNDGPRRMKNPAGPEGRLMKLRKTVTALVQHERLELSFPRAQEARQYTERLISEALRNGDCHKPTMEAADFWLLEKQLVHKLFKVLVPRFQNCDFSYTKMYKAPQVFPPNKTYSRSILELRGNPYPSLTQNMNTKNLLHNVLLDAAKFEYRQEKAAEMAKNLQNETNTTSVPENVS